MGRVVRYEEGSLGIPWFIIVLSLLKLGATFRTVFLMRLHARWESDAKYSSMMLQAGGGGPNVALLDFVGRRGFASSPIRLFDRDGRSHT